LAAQRVPKRRKTPQREMPKHLRLTLLALGLALVALGLVYAAYGFFAGPPAAEREDSAYLPLADLTTPEARKAQAQSRVIESKFPRLPVEAAPQEKPAPDYRGQRDEFLRKMRALGSDMKFFPSLDIPEPKPAAPVTLYCLLERPLEDHLEQEWREAGLLRNEAEVISPFLRTVTIDNAETLRMVQTYADQAAYEWVAVVEEE
jgi:hypothetical protein